MDLPFSWDDFARVIPSVCARDTAAGGGSGWTPTNPTWGHCAVVALWVQNLYGGKLLRVSLEGTPFAEARSHYFNRKANSFVEDLTREQFGGHLFKSWQPEERTREHTIGGADTRARYARFGVRLLEKLLPNHPLMRDAVYRQCITEALKSPCQKKGVGAVLMDTSGVVLEADHNDVIAGMASLCQPTCIRFKIPSRTESMIGACGHAEERVLWKSQNVHFLFACNLYVAAVDSRGLPEKRQFPEFTCLRCAVAMHYARIGAVNVAYQGERWVRQTGPEALASAMRYATGAKNI